MDKLRSLPQSYEDIIFPLMTVCPKLVLGGSLGLYVLGVMEYDFTNRKPDIDFSLTEPLTLEELIIIKDFFQLQFIIRNKDYEVTIVSSIDPLSGDYDRIQTPKPNSHFLTKEIIQLYKAKSEAVHDGTEHWDKEYIIDLFNSNYITDYNVVKVPYGDSFINITHPATILSHKSKYAYDNRVKKQYKHFKDIQDIDWDNYYIQVKKIQSKYIQIDDTTNYQVKYEYMKEEEYSSPLVEELMKDWDV
jgi:hypothetical protein